MVRVEFGGQEIADDIAQLREGLERDEGAKVVFKIDDTALLKREKTA